MRVFAILLVLLAAWGGAEHLAFAKGEQHDATVNVFVIRCKADVNANALAVILNVRPIDRNGSPIVLTGRAIQADHGDRMLSSSVSAAPGLYQISIRDHNCFGAQLVVFPRAPVTAPAVTIALGRTLSISETYAAIAGIVPEIGISGVEFICDATPGNPTRPIRGLVERNFYMIPNAWTCGGYVVVHLTRWSDVARIQVPTRRRHSLYVLDISARAIAQNILEDDGVGKR